MTQQMNTQLIDQPRDPATPVVELVVPVFNEAATLEHTVAATRRFLDEHFPYETRLTIADNASTDDTWTIAQHLANTRSGVRATHLNEKGRGHALHEVWSASDATVLAYMDVDMSTDLSALLPLIAPLVSGHSHVAIGSRLTRDAHVARGPKREFISRSYNMLLHASLGTGFSDAQCGFKAIRADAARELLPYVHDTQWFFDTELLVLADRAGLRIHEVPVDWVDDPDSRVDIPKTVGEDLRGIWRMIRTLRRIPFATIHERLPNAADRRRGEEYTPRRTLLGQLFSFGIIGACSTVAYAVLFLLFRGMWGAQVANFAALLITAIANTAANRAITFGIRGRSKLATHHVQGLFVFALGWILTSSALLVLHALAASPATWVEIIVLTVANLLATVLRFVLLKSWVFNPTSRTRAFLAHKFTSHCRSDKEQS